MPTHYDLRMNTQTTSPHGIELHTHGPVLFNVTRDPDLPETQISPCCSLPFIANSLALFHLEETTSMVRQCFRVTLMDFQHRVPIYYVPSSKCYTQTY